MSLMLSLLLTSETTLAREPTSGAASHTATASARAQPAPSRPTTLGWTLIIASLAAGAATTAYGLSVSCADDDERCERRASLAIWGGVGVASLGSAIGLAVIRVDDSQTAAASRLGSATLLGLTGTFH